jgi:hypothetical protein
VAVHGPDLLFESLSQTGVTDSYGNAWQYHPRSDRHSMIACRGIALDLILTSSLLRKHVAAGKVVLGVNLKMVDFGTGRSKNLDLVFARPDGTTGVRSLRSMAAEYGIQLDRARLALLDGLPE